jgi:hypothetical protein
MEEAKPAPNRSVTASVLKHLGLRKTAVGLRPLCGFLSAKVFCARKMLRIFLIGHKKPSVTAGTLCEVVIIYLKEISNNFAGIDKRIKLNY